MKMNDFLADLLLPPEKSKVIKMFDEKIKEMLELLDGFDKVK